ncbi:MAG: acetylglutamate kinase, partial [Chitinophagaceae bacterium]
MKKITIIKVGGKIIEQHDYLTQFCDHILSFYPDCIIVHGGGVLANELALKLNIPITMYEGRRITDKPMLDITLMAYAGIANKQLVAMLQLKNMDACGLSGCDMNIVQSHKRKSSDIDWGFVGDIDSVNIKKIKMLLDNKIIPVISPITYSKKGELLNTNADSVAS